MKLPLIAMIMLVVAWPAWADKTDGHDISLGEGVSPDILSAARAQREKARAAAAAQKLIPECTADLQAKTALASVGDIYEITMRDRHSYYSRFNVDFRAQAWVGGINTCGEGNSHYAKSKTRYRVDKVGRYVVYSAGCGGKMDVYDARAQVVFEGNSRIPVYVRTVMDVARYSAPNGMHSGPIKQNAEDLTCAISALDDSLKPILAHFADLPAYLEKGGVESTQLNSLYERAKTRDVLKAGETRRRFADGPALTD
ncbi:MAG: hypothetical protein Q7J64_05305 [Elusimicrobiota bacterium]|nr:hypothetical protein [Elusimicrobiota bacterium]